MNRFIKHFYSGYGDPPIEDMITNYAEEHTLKIINVTTLYGNGIYALFEKKAHIKPLENRYPWAICPSCGGSVYLRNVQEHIFAKETTYCEHCGQALDWSDDE